jgi:molybdenum cofactor cytidylyltransferase
MIRVYGLVPAAGKSERMGRPKLTLGLGDASVIQRVVRALEGGGADHVFVVAPPVPEAGSVVLANHARVEGAWVVHCPQPTPDMRATVEVGLDELSHGLVPPPDGLLLCPGDSPRISAGLVKQVLARFRLDPTRVVVPVHAGKKGHPVALPWALARAIPGLPAGVGINALVESEGDRVVRLEVDDPGAVIDLDTPEDYRRLVEGSGPAV